MRVSSEGERQVIDLQRNALTQAGVDGRHIFVDKASGIKDKCPGLQEALNFLQKDDCLLVWKLNRLGRSLIHLLDIINNLHSRGSAFCSLTEKMDTTAPHDELLFNLFGSLSQYERALTRERVMAGLESAKKRGRRGGRTRAVNEEKMDAILEDLKSGKSKAAICRNFGIKRSTLYDSLNRAGFSSKFILSEQEK